MFIAQATNCSFTLIVIYNYYMFIVQATDIMIIIKVEEHHSKEGSKESLFLLFELILGEDDGGGLNGIVIAYIQTK